MRGSACVCQAGLIPPSPQAKWYRYSARDRALAGVDEGPLPFPLSNSRLHGKSVYKNKRQERVKDCPRLYIDEGFLSLSLSNYRLYGESLYG